MSIGSAYAGFSLPRGGHPGPMSRPAMARAQALRRPRPIERTATSTMIEPITAPGRPPRSRASLSTIGQRAAGRLGRWLAQRGDGKRALPLPAPGERDLDALLADLQAIPSRLRPWPWATQRKGIPDMAMFLLASKRQTVNLGYS